MASLTGNVEFATWDDYQAMPMRASGADTFYRGALVWWVSGQIAATNDGASEFAGVVAEYVVTENANDPVLVYPASAGGLFLFSNANFTIANQGALFYQPATGEDDPSTLDTTTAGFSGAVGRLVQVKTTAVDGWLAIGDRFIPDNPV